MFSTSKQASALLKLGHCGWKQASARIYKRINRRYRTKRELLGASMAADPDPKIPDPDRLEVATDEAIAACGGNVRDTVKALIVANEYLESEISELMQAVSHAYARGRFKTYTG
jgi:hypothetical protein